MLTVSHYRHFAQFANLIIRLFCLAVGIALFGIAAFTVISGLYHALMHPDVIYYQTDILIRIGEFRFSDTFAISYAGVLAFCAVVFFYLANTSLNAAEWFAERYQAPAITSANEPLVILDSSGEPLRR